MATYHSYVNIKGVDGKTYNFTFPQVIYIQEGLLKDRVILLGNWIEDLKGKKDTIQGQIKKVKELWDEQHAAEIITAMGDCVELIDEALQSYQIASDNLVRLISAKQGVLDWLAENPDYNNIWKNHRNGNTYVYHKHIVHTIGPTTYKNVTLNFPA